MDFHAQYKRNCFCFPLCPCASANNQTDTTDLTQPTPTLQGDFTLVSRFIHTNKSIFHPVHTHISIGFLSKKEVNVLVCRINMVAINDITINIHLHILKSIFHQHKEIKTKKNMCLYLFSFLTANLKTQGFIIINNKLLIIVLQRFLCFLKVKKGLGWWV